MTILHFVFCCFFQHDIQIISVDGNDVTMTSAESVIVYGGERVDFILLASEDVDNYWVRAQTLEVSNGDGVLKYFLILLPLKIIVFVIH